MRSWTAMSRLLRALALVIPAGCAASQTAYAMNVRDILYLDKHGKEISAVSWCSDQAFTFITHGPPHNTVFPPEYSRDTTVNMFTMETENIQPVIVSEHAGFDATCVRNGEYVLISGGLHMAMAKDARSPSRVLFSEFINIRSGTSVPLATPVIDRPSRSAHKLCYVRTESRRQHVGRYR